MRKTILVLGLVALTLAASATDASAQLGRLLGGRRGGGGSMGIGSGYYGNGYYGNNYYGNGYGNGYYNNGLLGNNYYGQSGYYGGNGYSPGFSSSYYSSPNYYNSTPIYSNSTPSYYSNSTAQTAPDNRPSFYNDPSAANITVLLPAADARVWFDDAQTKQTGMERSFTTPSLQPGSYTYTIKAQWTDNGKNMDQTRQVRVQPGQNATVDFRRPAENVAVPKNVGD